MPETTSSSAAFIDAIKAGEFERVKAMVSANPTLIDARSGTGDSAILIAVYHRQKEIVNLLVARGASLSLFEACAAGELERVERLLEESAGGVNDTAATAGRRAFAAFSATPDRRAVDRHNGPSGALARRQRRTPLHAALAGSRVRRRAADRPRRRRQRHRRAGLAPLHLAAASNKWMRSSLIAQGADVHAANGEAKTPLSLATEKNHREAAALLRRHGA
jgi:ankyrin repeat protein